MNPWQLELGPTTLLVHAQEPAHATGQEPLQIPPTKDLKLFHRHALDATTLVLFNLSMRFILGTACLTLICLCIIHTISVLFQPELIAVVSKHLALSIGLD